MREASVTPVSLRRAMSDLISSEVDSRSGLGALSMLGSCSVVMSDMF